MIENLPDKADELRVAKALPLGILPKPNALPQGCIGAGDRAFFCDYALSYLAKAGIAKEHLVRDGYLIRTTLDPKVQASVKQADRQGCEPDAERCRERHDRDQAGQGRASDLAMGDNRTYGLNLGCRSDRPPQPFSLVGDGAGSIFKIFTTAAALDWGWGSTRSSTCRRSSRARALAVATARMPANDLVREECRQLSHAR